MAMLQERRLGYHSRAGLEPGRAGTSIFSTLRINHYATRGILPFPRLSVSTQSALSLDSERLTRRECASPSAVSLSLACSLYLYQFAHPRPT
jgi:hypothetical protein